MGLHRKLLVVALAALNLVLAAPTGTALTSPPNDPLYGSQYGPQQVRAPQAWATTTGAGVLVGIVDTGIDMSHPDLAAKVVSGATFLDCPLPEVSCGNGDWSSGPAGRASSRSLHGTHVGGIAAALTNNGVGIAGVAPDAQLLPVKVLDDAGGTTADIARGIRYAADRGARVVNLSIGISVGVGGVGVPGSGPVLSVVGALSEVESAVSYANSRGVVVVAAAGNDTFPICDSPSFNTGAMCVTATDRREAPSYYSNFGINPNRLAVSAPGGSGLPLCGEDIVSTVPVGSTSNPCRYPGGYEELAGTSMAMPHVAGAAALLAAQGRSRQNILSALQTTARQPVTGLRGVYEPRYGYGIIDAAAAVATPVG